jgi:predicted GIY-YIG superfamily endonuclease
MPRLPIDYPKTIIYKIVCNDLNITDCYVGHTTDFVRRKANHRSDCMNEKKSAYNSKVYKTVRENGGWDNYSMIKIEKYPCKDANEACAKEREWFEILHSNLNSFFPQRGREEYRCVNKEKISSEKKVRVICSTCGANVSNCALPRHLRTDKHKSAIAANEEANEMVPTSG